MTGACGCEKFPLRKGGQRRRRGGCLARPEGQGTMVAPFEIRCVEVRLSPIRKTTPGRLRDRCRYVTAVATPPPPLTKGEFFHRLQNKAHAFLLLIDNCSPIGSEVFNPRSLHTQVLRTGDWTFSKR